MRSSRIRWTTDCLCALSNERGIRAGYPFGRCGGNRSDRRVAASDGRHLAIPIGHRLDGARQSLAAAARPSTLLLLAEPCRLGFSLRDGVWVRLIDVRAALLARSFRPQGSVVIEVADEFCPWNAGRWRIGSAGVERTDEAPALRCDASVLGSVYLGGFTWTQLARGLRVQELIRGAIVHADSIFQVTSAPWCPEIF